MSPTAAETARTLAAGRLPGRLTMSALPGDIPVPHATTADGQVFVAAHPGSRAWQSLAAGARDEAAVLTIDDVPPFPESPWLGRVHVYGWLQRADDADLRDAASAFAAANSVRSLPGLGLFRIEVGEVRLDPPGTAVLEPEQFAAAAPDPLHPYERDLLLDLREYHLDELARLMPEHPAQCLPVRLDQHGLVLALPRLHRFEFPSPADCPRCVGHALRLSHVGHL